MKHMFVGVVALAAMFANPVIAQDTCPKTKAQTVPLDVQFFGLVKCGSVSFTIGGTTFSGPNQGCPLLAVQVPTHEVEVPQTNGNRTKTRIWGQVATEVYHYVCERDYLLFVPWDSTCTLERRHAGAALPRMTTVACDPWPPTSTPVEP
jgi:hypothetical protein